MKKLTALMVALCMLMALAMPAFADDPATLPELLEDLSIESTRDLDVPVDIKIDAEGNGSFVDGPVTKTGSATVDYQATIYMKPVRDAYNAYMTAAELLVAGVGTLESQLDNCKISGNFTIKVIYPETARVPEVVLAGSNLYGFNSAAAAVFKETGRVVTNGTVSGTKELTITIEVAGPAPARAGYVVATDMTANLATYLPDITFTCADVVYTSLGDHVVIGSIVGSTYVHDEFGSLVATINYTGKQGTESEGIVGDAISETVTVTASGGINAGPSSSGGSVVIVPKDDIEVTVDVPGVEKVEPVIIPSTVKNPTVDIDELTEEYADKREGFALDGFYAESTYATKLEGKVPVSEDTTVYAKWINVTAPAIFNSEEHIKYINGYPDETVRPQANITREEVATIFYRLLKDDVRAEIETSENNFTDVEADRWSCAAISTMANGDYINGYPDGTFKPEAFITRAELATLTSRFMDKEVSGNKSFSDIAGHWAEESIVSIANNEWITGYEDGSFRPDAYITRAEAITIINRIIVRYVNEQGVTEDIHHWSDNDKDAWYYYAIVEASNEHTQTRAENGYHEIWSK